jgi:large subunit ribosomal protein L21
MYAIIKTGGKQYRVEKGDQIKIEKLDAAEGSTVVFDKVLAAGEGADLRVGAPYVDGLTVEGTVVESGKSPKVVIFKYKAKKDYRRKQGHRQPYTLVEITAIGEAKTPEKEAPEHKPLSKMLKAELVEYAKNNGIEINEKATKAVIIETIEAAK